MAPYSYQTSQYRFLFKVSEIFWLNIRLFRIICDIRHSLRHLRIELNNYIYELISRRWIRCKRIFAILDVYLWKFFVAFNIYSDQLPRVPTIASCSSCFPVRQEFLPLNGTKLTFSEGFVASNWAQYIFEKHWDIAENISPQIVAYNMKFTYVFSEINKSANISSIQYINIRHLQYEK